MRQVTRRDALRLGALAAVTPPALGVLCRVSLPARADATDLVTSADLISATILQSVS